jgi:BA14K-like protein
LLLQETALGFQIQANTEVCMRLSKALLSAATAAVCWTAIVTTSEAAPAHVLTGSGVQTAASTIAAAQTTVQYRRPGRAFYGRPYAYRYGYRRPYYGYGYGLPLVAGVATTVIIAEAIRENRARPSDFERCAAQFRSFNPRTGTYVTYAGDVRICPYLD